MSPWLVAFAVGTKLAGLAGAICGAPVALWLAVIFLPDFVILHQMFWPSAGAVCPVIRDFTAAGNEVWLTIDDGPDPDDTPRNLALLRQYGAKATFFVIGKYAAAHPELVRQILREGHDVAHHTQTHPAWNFWHLGRAGLAHELDPLLALFHSLGHRAGYFRPPVGIKNIFLAAALRRRGLLCVAWTIRTYDSIGKSATEIAKRVRRRLRPGVIILLHEGPRLDPTVRQTALEAVLRVIEENGYQCILPTAPQLRLKPSVILHPPSAEQCSA